MSWRLGRAFSLSLALVVVGCGDDFYPKEVPDADDVHAYVGACVIIGAESPGGGGGQLLRVSRTGEAFDFGASSEEEAARFVMKPSDIGTYLFRDSEHRHLVSDGADLLRPTSLESDVTLVDDDYSPGAEWVLEVSTRDERHLQIRHLDSGRYLGKRGLVDKESKAARVTLFPAEGCVEFPELTLDAEGTPTAPVFDDGSLFGIVDTHSHLLSNFSFGGGGIFHGAPFHRLGVEHALSDCTVYHGEDGRRDLLGFGFDQGAGGDGMDNEALILGFITKQTPDFNHHTDGFPTFTTWPSAHVSSTHQAQYYKWLQRAYLGGLRLVVQHATSNQVICDLLAGPDIQPVRYSCNDMVAIDRILEETRNMERYIDAHEGGPGQGWFRIVTSPAEAREVIAAGKMAVILGIEVSNLFDCFLVPPPGAPTCDEAHVLAELDRYEALGVRAIFPVHKLDNAFSAGDGDRAIMELANFVHTGHWLNFTEDCPEISSIFDKGNVAFGGLNAPRDVYDSPPPNDTSGFPFDPFGTLLPFLEPLLEGGTLEGDYCQNHGLTELGEFLMNELMRRGMIIEIDHLPRRGYQRAFEMLEDADYPAAGTHGLHHDGEIYRLGGVSKSGLGRCHGAEPGTSDDGYQARIALMESMGAFPAEGFGFDLNGFAGAPGPRFGPRSGCGEEQQNPVTYPFTSWAGDVTFSPPRVGERSIDFNTEGFAHIGMLPELIQDVLLDGVPKEDLEPLFKSAEGYIRMWEKAQTRGAAISAAP